jgi:hypothetical protein
MYCWVREVFPGYAVYEREGKLWRVDYTVSGTEITVAAESKEVVPEYVPADNAATSMAALADQWLEIFKAGSYGDKGDYSPRTSRSWRRRTTRRRTRRRW